MPKNTGKLFIRIVVPLGLDQDITVNTQFYIGFGTVHLIKGLILFFVMSNMILKQFDYIFWRDLHLLASN